MARFAGNLHARAGNLLRKLARGADDAHARRTAAALDAGQRGQRGQQECRRLARAGGSGGDDVAAFQNVGNGLFLNRCGSVVAHALDGGKRRLGQAEFCKCGHVNPFLFAVESAHH